MFSQLTHIFMQIILPILIMVGLGALVHRLWPLQVQTLSRLNVYLFIPIFLFVNLYQSTLSPGKIGMIILLALLPMVALGIPLYGYLRWRGAKGEVIAAVVVGGLIYNAGYYGLPVAEMFYTYGRTVFPGMSSPADGPAVQLLIIMTSNLTIWLLGYVIFSLAKGQGVKGAAAYFKLPMIYVLALAFTCRWIKNQFCSGEDFIPVWLMAPMKTMAPAVVPVALVTLGAQMIQRVRWPRWKILLPVMSVKLLLLPVATALLVWAMGLWPWPGAQLVIAAAAPTAVNTLLLTLELDGDAELMADLVFWTTVVSSLTVSVTLVAVSMLGQATIAG